MTLGTEVHEQMFQSGDQSDANPEGLVPKQAWYSFIDPLKAESTLAISRSEPRTCCVEERYAITQPFGISYIANTEYLNCFRPFIKKIKAY
ncbi:hypothetical protein TNCV_4429601 [Trichonephila clavipes]|nr:hypothetical protein TNCV_4429601 [Trichonephila clavipes]